MTLIQFLVAQSKKADSKNYFVEMMYAEIEKKQISTFMYIIAIICPYIAKEKEKENRFQSAYNSF